MFASRTKEVVTVKDGDRDVSVTIRKLSDRSLMKAAEARQIALAAQVKPFGADMLQAMRESASKTLETKAPPTEEESRKSRAMAYDRETILTQGIESWTASERLTSALNAVVNNKVYLAGGFNATAMSEQTWVFDPMARSGSKWTPIASADLAAARAYIMGAVVDGKIYAVGGASWDGAALINLDTVQMLDPAAGTPTWTPLASLTEACSSSRAWGFDTGSILVDPTDMTPLSGKIISGCGFWSTANQAVYAYTVATNSWEAFPSFLTARRDTAGEYVPLEVAPALWVFGGYDGTSVNTTTVEYYSLGVIPVELQSFTIE